MLPLFFASALSLMSPVHAAETWPALGAPAATSRDGSKDAALVIAIDDYAFAQDIPGALDNGRAWVSWLKDGHGVPLVKPLFNQQAAKETMKEEVAKVAARVQPGGRLWVVYIGHGAPSEAGDDGVLVGVDAQQTPSSLEARGLKRAELLAAAEAAMPSGTEVVLVQDACFSGKTSRGDLAPGMAPLKTVSARLGPKVTVLSAARSDEYAGPLSDGKRPAFSYLVLGALRGWGDRNGDGRVSAQEAVAYADDALVQTTTGRSQTPELSGPDVALGRSGKERAPDLTALAMAAVSAPVASVGSAGQVQVDLGGSATDFAALAAQAAAADAAAADASQKRAAAQAALDKERRKRLDGAAADVQAAAKRDFASISSLLSNPTENSRKVLEAWLSRYDKATVTIDGVTESVLIPEVARVQQAIGRIAVSSSPSGSASGEWTGRSGYGMVGIPAGSFLMGSPSSESGRDADETQHQVTLTRGFLMGKTEVTQGLWSSVMGSNPSAPDYKGVSLLGDSLPVQNVDWCDAVAFANKLSAKDGLRAAYTGVDQCKVSKGTSVAWDRSSDGYRLPTEAEWEYAARAGKTGPYAGGVSEDGACRIGNVGDASAKSKFSDWTTFSCNDGVVGLASVGRYAANPWGLHDMTGNVWEWCWDRYADYSGTSTDPVGPQSGSYRVDRGGSWSDDPRYARVAYRGRNTPDFRFSNLGLRLVRTNP